MKSHEVHRDEWVPFCHGFSRRHDRWRVSIEVREGGIGSEHRLLARDVPLLGLSCEPTAKGPQAVTLAAGESSQGTVTHVLPDAVRIVLDVSDDGVRRGVRIESASGSCTVLRFRSPQPADRVGP